MLTRASRSSTDPIIGRRDTSFPARSLPPTMELRHYASKGATSSSFFVGSSFVLSAFLSPMSAVMTAPSESLNGMVMMPNTARAMRPRTTPMIVSATFMMSSPMYLLAAGLRHSPPGGLVKTHGSI